MSKPSERSLELAVVALEGAAQACQSGATLRGKGSRNIDPLAREYLVAAEEVETLLKDEYNLVLDRGGRDA